MTANGVDYGVVECVEDGVLRWFGHIIRMRENESKNRVYEGKIKGGSLRG